MSESPGRRLVGFGAHKLPLRLSATPAERLTRTKDMLSRVLNLRTTVAVTGAGCTASLGYPSWRGFCDGVVAHTIETLAKIETLGTVHDVLARLRGMQAELARGATVRAERMQVMLGFCRQVCERHGMVEIHRTYVRDLFRPRPLPAGVDNPYAALLRLPIRRFATTNYDAELERAILAHRDIPRARWFGYGREIAEAVLERDGVGPDVGIRPLPTAPDPDPELRAFTQRPEYGDQLALFVMARVTEANDMVFHCHGRYDDPESLVVTEADYQEWYLGDRHGTGAVFRQAIEILFASNPILFVGYGMADEDLLRPLRMVVAVARERRESRPLFALLPEEDEGADWEYHEYLFERYGVQVVPYFCPATADARERGRRLCDALRGLEVTLVEWRRGWLQKPLIRQVTVATKRPHPCHHYALVSTPGEVFGRERFDLEERKWRNACTRPGVVVLLGQGGTGKSWQAMRLMEHTETTSDNLGGSFFWSSYYADDALTGLDRALGYLDPHNDKQGTRFERLRECLKEARYFLIFDGIERLLSESDVPDVGHAHSPFAAEFLRALTDGESRSTVILTTRLWPALFGPMDPRPPRTEIIRLPPMCTDDIRRVGPFASLSREDVSALCSLLGGHAYGLRLAVDWLFWQGTDRVAERVNRLRRALYDTPPDRRLWKMIEEVVDQLDRDTDGLAGRLLQRLAVFMSPVSERVIDLCYASAQADDRHEATQGGWQDGVGTALLKSHLLYRASVGPEETDPPGFTVHPIVRGYVFHRLHGTETDALPNFALPGFTAGSGTVDPGSPEGARVVCDVFERLDRGARDALDRGDGDDALMFCRGAFGVLRSRMTANTCPRWCDYDRYLQLTIRVANLAKGVSLAGTDRGSWDYASPSDLSDVEHPRGPLFADELAWLYNEIGLVCYGEGTMLDALAVWEQGYEINRLIDRVGQGGQYLFQSQCNLGAANIHYGRLPVAEQHFKDALRTNFFLQDPDHAGRITGYLALIDHLRGNLKKAEQQYKAALEYMEAARLAGRANARAESIFQRHLGDLQITLGEYDDARMRIRTSRAIAEAARLPELVAFARNSMGHWYRSQGKLAEAVSEYNAALAAARRIGIRRLEADVYSELSRTALDLGDYQTARQQAIAGLEIANELVLGLRQTHGLVVLGLASARGGLRDFGLACLRHARTLAERQEYRLRGLEIENLLQALGQVGDEPWRQP